MYLIRRKNGNGPGNAVARNDRVDDLFAGFFEDFTRPMFGNDWNGWPAVDVSEDGEKLTVQAELPGITSEDVEVTVHDDVLTIAGEKKQSEQKEGEGYRRTERRYGSFERRIHLPYNVDTEKVEATCRDGILTVTLPKSEKDQARRIKVEG